MNKLFNCIAHLNCDGNDWRPLIERQQFAVMVMALRPKLIVEIGVFGGSSLFPMALALKEIGSGQIIGIDPWEAQASAEGQAVEADRKWWGTLDHEAVFRKFMALRENLTLGPYIHIVRKRSDNVLPPKDIGLLNIDGNHGPQVLKDVERFVPNVIVGGLVILDDVLWSGGSVQRAAESMIDRGLVKLYDLGHGSVFQKIR